MYSRERYEKGLGKAIFSVSDPESIIETIELTETYK
jgi:hypothetical protein